MTKPNNDTVRQIYCEFDAKCAQAVYKYSSSRDYETHTLIPSIALKEEMKAAFESLLEEAKKLPNLTLYFSKISFHRIPDRADFSRRDQFSAFACFMSKQTWVLDFTPAGSQACSRTFGCTFCPAFTDRRSVGGLRYSRFSK